MIEFDNIQYSTTAKVDIGLSYNGGLMEQIYIQGWAFAETESSNEGKTIDIIFRNEKTGDTFSVTTGAQRRDDVYAAFRNTMKIYNGQNGIECKVATIQMPYGVYRMFILVHENNETHGFIDTGLLYEKTHDGFDPYSAEIVEVNEEADDALKTCVFTQFTSSAEGRAFFDTLEMTDGASDEYHVQGWGFCNTQADNQDKKITLVFKHTESDLCYSIAQKPTMRDDVYRAFCDTYAIQGYYHGFDMRFSVLPMKDGIYDLYVYVQENEADYGLFHTGAQFQKMNGDFSKY